MSAFFLSEYRRVGHSTTIFCSLSRATIKFGIDAQGKLVISEIAPNSAPPIDASLKDNVLTVSVLGK